MKRDSNLNCSVIVLYTFQQMDKLKAHEQPASFLSLFFFISLFYIATVGIFFDPDMFFSVVVFRLCCNMSSDDDERSIRLWLVPMTVPKILFFLIKKRALKIND